MKFGNVIVTHDENGAKSLKRESRGVVNFIITFSHAQNVLFGVKMSSKKLNSGKK